MLPGKGDSLVMFSLKVKTSFYCCVQSLLWEDSHQDTVFKLHADSITGNGHKLNHGKNPVGFKWNNNIFSSIT